MEAPRGGSDPAVTTDAEREPLDRKLFRAPWAFDFFQAVRLLERLRPNRARVGRDARPEREAVRFRAHNSLAFPASPIQGLESPDGRAPDPAELDGPVVARVNHFGLTGPMGALPLPYTELLVRLPEPNETPRAVADFLDVFNHRLVAMLYRAWERNRPLLGHEDGTLGAFRAWLLAPLGLRDPDSRRAATIGASVPEEALLWLAPLFADRRRSLHSLVAALRDQFEETVVVEQFHPRRLRLPVEERSRLGSAELGVSTILGESVPDATSTILIRVGPLDLARHLEFQPGGPAWRRLAGLVRLFLDDQLDFAVQLVLRRQDVPGCRLGGDEAQDQGGGNGLGALGRSTWLRAGPAEEDDDQAVFRAWELEPDAPPAPVSV